MARSTRRTMTPPTTTSKRYTEMTMAELETLKQTMTGALAWATHAGLATGMATEIGKIGAEMATRQAEMRYVVLPLQTNGFPAKIMAPDRQWNATRTYKDAAARKIVVEQMNPAKQFVIVCI